MKSTINKSAFAVLTLSMLTVFTSCEREDKLEPTPVTNRYTLPQGNSDFDNVIVNFHQKYGKYILYRFDHSDYAYNYTSMKSDSAFNANPAYIDTALNFFLNQLVNHYPEEFLHKTLPFKILLASYIGSGASRSATGFASTNSALTIGWADSTLLEKTPAQLREIRGQLHRHYFERAIRTKSVEIPEEFFATAPSGSYPSNSSALYAAGVVERVPSGSVIYIEGDFLGFIQLITGKTTAELESTLFLPATDKNGLIRRRYDIIQNYFLLKYNLDLKAIGNLP